MKWSLRIGTMTLCAMILNSLCSLPASGQDDSKTLGNLGSPAGIDFTMFDTKVRPQDDLFRAVNGRWLKTVKIPNDKSNYGSFIALADISQARIRNLIEAAAKEKNEPGSEADKIGKFYKSYMDQDRCNQMGVSPMVPELIKVGSIRSKEELVDYFARCQKVGIGTPIGAGVTVDAKNSTQHLAVAIQSGITLPDPTYYTDEEKEEIREKFVDFVDRLFKLSGVKTKNAGETVLKIESALAKVHWSRVELRNANKRYNKFKVSELNEKAGRFPWKRFFDGMGVGHIKEINIMTPSYFVGFSKVFEDVSLKDWKTYMTFQVLDGFATALSEDFVNASFDFHQKTLAQVQEIQPRWKRAVDTTGGVLGEAVGKVYVARHFKPAAKKRMKELVDNLLRAFDSSIDDLSWMTDETKKRAKEKLSKITTKIGYPDKWRDYSKLEISETDLVGNLIAASRFGFQRQVEKLGKPVDRTEWGMTPQTVNAYYNPTKNEIVFPAAILQPPFFNQKADDAVNYGGIGAVIGHEISHAFDDQGSKFDGEGNLNNWWTDQDRKSFSELTQKLIAQYEVYAPEELGGEKKVNGKLTLGENIADLSGLSIAYKAYKISLEGKKSKEMAGWSGEQRVFLGWSQVWRRKYRNAELVRRLLIDPHSPSRYRANGPVTNIEAFQEAFDLKPGDRLYKKPADRIRIW